MSFGVQEEAKRMVGDDSSHGETRGSTADALVTRLVSAVFIVGLALLVGLIIASKYQALPANPSTQIGNPSTCGTWNIITDPDFGLTPYGAEFRDIAVISNDDVWLVGDQGIQQPLHFRALIAHWDGNKLTAVPAPHLEDRDFRLEK